MIDWNNTDTVLLDMDGTLLDLAYDNWFWQQHLPQEYAKAKALDQEQAYRVIGDWIRSHQGTLNWYCLDFWTRELGVDVASMKRNTADRVCLRPGAKAFLEALAASNKEVIMVTNAHRDSLSVKLQQTGIARYFNELVSSHDYGHAKEEQAFWQHLRRHLPFDPARALLVDDSLPVLHSARLYGIAQPVSILHPDSSQPARHDTYPFNAISAFEAVMP